MEKIAASIAEIAAEAAQKAGPAPRASLVDLPTPVLDGLGAWIASRGEPRPTLSEAIRTGLTEWLSAQGYLPGDGGGARDA